jgi:hypothetical protein
MAVTINGTNGITTNSGTVISASTIGVGGATPSGSGAGITFPATQSASTNANTLDDYEEGTWTPIYGRTGTAPTVAYTGVVGLYRKIGSFVWVAGRIATTSFTGGSGNLYIGGLPFTVATDGNDYGSFNIGVSFGGWSAGFAPTAGYPTQSSTQIVLATYDSADARNGLDTRITTIGTSTNGIVFSCTYYTS